MNSTLSDAEVRQVVAELRDRISDVFPGESVEAILFGSYARGTADEESDVDVMLLVDSDRETIAARTDQIAQIVSDMTIKYYYLVSPVVENRDYFINNFDVIPLFRNVFKDGIRQGDLQKFAMESKYADRFRAEGRKAAVQEIILRMIRNHCSLADIVLYTCVSPAEVCEIAEKHGLPSPA